MQANGAQLLGLQTPGAHVDGMHDGACACALLTRIAATIAGAV
jgi:hypothetical protein